MFDPSGYAVKNNNLVGLPFTKNDAKIVLLPIPWDVTASSAKGTVDGPECLLEASYQLDLYDWDYQNAWQFGIYMDDIHDNLKEMNGLYRSFSDQHISMLEAGLPADPHVVRQINEGCVDMNNWVYNRCDQLLNEDKMIGIIGGEHSVPFGFIKALSERYTSFGILQIDAHADLRRSYEHLEYSHASIMYNVSEQIQSVTKIIQVGVREICQDEIDYAHHSDGKVIIHDMYSLRENITAKGLSYSDWVDRVIADLPDHVYISFDIDGLDPKLCPGTGTPVPDGFELHETFLLIKRIVDSGRKIIGFDLCEVGSSSEWDGFVGAKVAYKLSNAMFASQQPTK